MYCPGCGSNNHSDVKFCTRCGTNLGVVSEALSQGLEPGAQLDDRVVKVIKEYYKGRRDTITGVVLIPAALKLMALMVLLLHVRPIPAFFIVSWMIFWGIAALAGGLGKWIGAAGEMKALGHELPRSKLVMRAENLLRGGSTAVNNYSTGPVSAPISTTIPVSVSVTEQTTRTLEERIPPPKQTQ